MNGQDRRGPQQNRDAVRSAAGEAREYALDNLGEVDHADVSAAAGLFQEEDQRDLMVFAEQAYNRRKDDDDPDFWDTPWANERRERAASTTLTRAIREGNLSQMEYITGMPEYENDVSGLNTTRKLENWLCYSDRCKLIYLAGLMGNGKTDWSLSMLNQVYWTYKRIEETIGEFGGDPAEVPTPEFAANFKVDPAPDGLKCHHFPSFDDLVRWGEQGSSDLERWFIFDEASTELTAQSGANAQDVADMFAPFVKKMRKLGINMIVVGHDKGDVHVAIRSLADFVAKPGTKRASVYAGISNREPKGHMFDLDRIPETNWGYKTDDMAAWSWGNAAEDADFDGFTETDVKRMTAKRAVSLMEEHGFSEEKAASTLSDDEISISRYMVREAKQGAYGPVSA